MNDVNGFFDITDPIYGGPNTGQDYSQAFNLAITDAANLGGGVIYVPPNKEPYNVTQTIHLQSPVELMGGSSTSIIARGTTQIQAPADVSPIIKVTGGPASGSSSIRRLAICHTQLRNSNSIGIMVENANYVLLEDLYLFKHEHAILLRNQNCLGTSLNRVIFSQATASYCYLSSCIETTFSDCKFGRNGATSQDPQCLIILEGSTDTTRFNQCQFNPRSPVQHAFWFLNYSTPNGIIAINKCHMECVENGFSSDSTTQDIIRLALINSQFHVRKLFNLDAVSSAKEWRIIGNNISTDDSIRLQKGNKIIFSNNTVSGPSAQWDIGPGVTNYVLSSNC
jgi:hypothetical protein